MLSFSRLVTAAGFLFTLVLVSSRAEAQVVKWDGEKYVTLETADDVGNYYKTARRYVGMWCGPGFQAADGSGEDTTEVVMWAPRQAEDSPLDWDVLQLSAVRHPLAKMSAYNFWRNGVLVGSISFNDDTGPSYQWVDETPGAAETLFLFKSDPGLYRDMADKRKECVGSESVYTDESGLEVHAQALWNSAPECISCNVLRYGATAGLAMLGAKYIGRATGFEGLQVEQNLWWLGTFLSTTVTNVFTEILSCQNVCEAGACNNSYDDCYDNLPVIDTLNPGPSYVDRTVGLQNCSSSLGRCCAGMSGGSTCSMGDYGCYDCRYRP